MVQGNDNAYDSRAHTENGREFVLTRLLRAPREVVWQAFTDAEHLGRWWGPSGFTTTTHVMDFREGGKWDFVMHGPDGHDYPNFIRYTKTTPHSRIEYHHGGDEAIHPGGFDMVITFEPRGDRNSETLVTFRGIFPTQAALEEVVNKFGALEGGKQTLARLAEYVWNSLGADANQDRFKISRVINAPIELVWDAFTVPKHLAQWLGPPGCESATRFLDLRAGGRMHYSMRMPGGGDHEHFGLWVFREVTPPTRLVFVSSFADDNGKVIRAFFNPDWPLEILSTITFEPHAGIGRGTLVTISGVPLNASAAELKAYRDHTGSMTAGWNGSFDRLKAYAPTMGA